MLSMYPACFYEESDGRYSVIFPDLNGLATMGDTKEEAYRMAVDCLAGYIHSCKRDGESFRAPSEISAIDFQRVSEELGDPDPKGFVSMVAVDVEEYARQHFDRPIRKTLTIPAWLNALAEENHIDLSQTLQNALKEQLGAV